MNLGFRVDASKDIGYGHWSRCLNLSKILKSNNTYFFSKSYVNNLKDSKINLIKLKKNISKDLELIELKKKIQINKIDILIIDNYKYGYSFQKKIKKYVKKLIIIDDYINKKYICDIYLNYSFFNSSEKKFLKRKNFKLAIGTKYLPLDKKFHFFKKKKRIRKNIRNILVFFGGTDKTNLIIRLLKLCKYFNNLKFYFVIGEAKKKKICRFLKHQKNIKLFFGIKNKKMASLIHNCDLAIGSGGVNLYERIFLGLPSIVIRTSLNQRRNIVNSKRKKLIINIKNDSSIINMIKKKILYLIKNKKIHEKFSKNCYKSIKNNQNGHLNKLIKL